MENSILTSTKKILGVAADYTEFDLDVITHINAAFSTLNQLGICPEGFSIEDDTAIWDDLQLSQSMLSMVKTYVYLKVRLVFDPPGTSFVLDSLNKQVEQYEWRMNAAREAAEWVDPDPASSTVEEPAW